MARPAEELALVSARGERLAGLLHAPDEAPRGLVVLSPCFTCTRDIAPVRNLARDLADAGYLACRFDPIGTGKSDGRFEEATVSRYRDDLVAVARALAPRASPLHLVGHRLGGVVSLLAARAAGAVTVTTLASNATRAALLRLIGSGTFERARREGSAPFDPGDGVSRNLSRELVLDLERHDPQEEARTLARPLLVLHGDRDAVVPLERGRELAAATGARLEVVAGGGHLLSRPEDRVRIREAVLAFLGAPRS